MPALATVVIGAAGTGSRLGVGIPKCLVSVDGRSIIDRQLDLLADVPDVRVVVGYREDQVVRHVVARRPDAIFVRNPAYSTTTTLHSTLLAVRHLGGRPFLALDGDLLVEPESFGVFLDRCEREGPPLIGVCRSGTDEAVFVTRDGDGAVTSFHRQPGAEFEWSGPAFLASEHLEGSDGYVFQALERFLPLPAHEVVAREVDTPGDLERAQAALRTWSAPRPAVRAFPGAA
ncbi:MAG TPA: NTP transferase domain-containing protein [Acidimicrobiales bacterium]|nr:NTP transferase domain-containing protein [Acidimicrobiales bacterium]